MDCSQRLIAITGGIGSGKSVVCRMLCAMGYPVYDCDTEAKRIMDRSDVIKQGIAREICAEAISEVGIDQRKLSETVFGSPELLNKLNALVHSAVRDDLAQWSADKPLAFVETAILYQSGLHRMVDEVWNVTAPEEVRISRVMKRNSLDRASIERRISAQDSFVIEEPHEHVREIVNDDVEALLPQINSLLAQCGE